MMMFRTNASSDVETMFDQIRADVLSGFEALGQQETEEWQDRISVDVERGPPIVRSSPGEPPRRETGKLWESISFDTEVDADVVAVNVGSDVEYALYLQYGTFEMFPRPMLPDLDTFTERLLDVVVTAIEGG